MKLFLQLRSACSGGTAARNFDISLARLVVACLVVLAHVSPAFSCTFHDPKILAQGLMNHMYPNSLYVNGAIMQARKAGHLPQVDSQRLMARGSERHRLDRIAYGRTLSALYSLGVAIDSLAAQEDTSAVSVVVLDTMLWARYSDEYTDVREGLHYTGPVSGDTVLVTDEPVILAIRDGAMTINQAVELGVIRIYADEQERDELLDRLGSIGEAPLQDSGFAALMSGERFGFTPVP
ncbi:MAG: hypothetical protein ACR2QG_01955 [Gammaproteobacteria bacterium]